MDDDRERGATLGNNNSLQREEVEESFNGADEDFTAQRNDNMSQTGQCEDSKGCGNPLAGCANGGHFVDCNGGALTHATQDLHIGTDSVPCDSCIQSPQRAVKSCLTCLVSYCEAHLRPHLENVRFRSHRLVEPQLDLEMRCCPEHRLPLELYCCPDARCICPACKEQGHQEHQSMPVREARRLAEAEMQRKKVEMMKTISIAEGAITNLQNNTTSAEGAVMGLQAIVEQQFSRLHLAVERARTEVWEVLEGELERTVGQAEGIRAHLHLKICHLKRTLDLGEKFSNSNNSNDVDFMQEYHAWLRNLVNTDLPGVYIGLPDRLATFRQALSSATQELCEQLLATYRHQLTDLSQKGLGIHTAIQSTPSDHNEPEPVVYSDFLRYATNLTVNVDSAHQFLRVTEGIKRMTNTTPWQHCYPEHPERFEHWRQALASESLFLGRHYFEVELIGDGAYVGLTYKSIKRKSAEHSSCITGNTFSWSLGRNSHSLSCWHGGEESCLQGEPLSRVGVYVDYQSGVVAFYGVAMSMKLLYKYTTQFLEPLYPAFWLSKKDNVIILHILDEKTSESEMSIPASKK